MRNVAIIASVESRFTLLGTIVKKAFSLAMEESPRVYYFRPARNFLAELYTSQRGIVLTILDDLNCEDPLGFTRDIRKVGSNDVIIVSSHFPVPVEYFSSLGPICTVRNTLTDITNRLPVTVCSLLKIPPPRELSVYEPRLSRRGRFRTRHEEAVRYTVNGREVSISGHSRRIIFSKLLDARKEGTTYTSVDALAEELKISRAGVFAAMSRLRDILAEQTEGKGRWWIENSRDEGYRLVW